MDAVFAIDGETAAMRLALSMLQIRQQLASSMVPTFGAITCVAVIISLGAILVLFFGQITGTIWSVLIVIVVTAFAFVMYAVAAITTRSWYQEFLKPV